MADYELVVHRVPMVDMGIGQEMGYESDAAFLDAMREQHAALDSEIRAAAEQVEADVLRAFLYGR